MEDETCILCGQSYPAGLHVLGCLICFPCERRLTRGCVPTRGRKGLCRLYAPSPLRGGGQL